MRFDGIPFNGPLKMLLVKPDGDGFSVVASMEVYESSLTTTQNAHAITHSIQLDGVNLAYHFERGKKTLVGVKPSENIRLIDVEGE